MTTDRIPPSSISISALRAITRKHSPGVQRSTASANTGGVGQATPVVAEHELQALRQRLRGLATKADLDDAASASETRNAAIREVLLWEFGSQFRTDSQFMPMIDAINKAFDADPTLQKQFIAWVADLRNA